MDLEEVPLPKSSPSMSAGPSVLFAMILHVGRRSRQVYKLHSGPGDNGEHVMTILRRDED